MISKSAVITEALREEEVGRLPSQNELSDILALFWGFVPYHVVRVAVQEGLFEFLAQRGSVPNRALAEEMGWKERPTKMLIGILESLELVHKSETGNTITEKGRKWFLRESPLYIGDYFYYTSMIEDAYRNLKDHLMSDLPDPVLESIIRRSFGLTPDGTIHDVLRFGEILTATSIPIAEDFFRLIDIPRDAAVLDVGAGTGTFTRCLLDLGHEGSIDFLDTPLVCGAVKPSFKDNADRIDWLAVNWSDWTPSKTYDAIFLHHVLHEEPQANAEQLFSKCVAALNPEGRLYVIGLIEPDRDTNSLARYFGMNILLEIGGDNTETEWLRSVATRFGLIEVGVHALSGGRTLWIGGRKR